LVRGAGAISVERGAGATVSRSFSVAGGMCPRCEGMGTATDIDLPQLYDGRSRSPRARSRSRAIRPIHLLGGVGATVSRLADVPE
jgi:excinuclease UvrABC ATPase subunit